MTSAFWVDPLMPLTARVGAASDVGNYRQSNEDLFLLDPDPDHPFAAVLDGMGGQDAGADAARVGAEVTGRVLTGWLASGEDPPEVLRRTVEDAHAAILDLQKAPDRRGCGTTVLTALLYDARVYVTWAGDSMAYRVSGGKVERLTWPHDVSNILTRLHGYGPERCGRRLGHYLGGTLPDAIEVPWFEPLPGDQLILATDGVWTLLEAAHLLAACRSHPDPLACAEHLVKLALDNGSRDNATCVVVAFDGDPPMEERPARRGWWPFRR